MRNKRLPVVSMKRCKIKFGTGAEFNFPFEMLSKDR